MKFRLLLLITLLTLFNLVIGCSKKSHINTVDNTVSQKQLNSSAATVVPKTSKEAKPSQGTQEISIDQLPDNTVVVTVGKNPITIGEYRHMFKMQELQMENMVNMDSAFREHMYQEAKNQGLSLSPDEKTRLLEAARKDKGNNFNSFLKQKNISEQDFNKEVERIGLSFKAINAFLRQNLLSNLINRDLIITAAKSDGFMNKANSRYSELKQSPRYQQLLSMSHLSPAQLKDMFITDGLTQLMTDKIMASAKVDNSQIQKFYDQHKSEFQHKERVRISQILVLAPSQDLPNAPSMQSQIAKTNPALKGKALDDAVQAAMSQQKAKAEQLLAKVKSGADFTQLANQNSDDVMTRLTKNGGDTGWQNRDNLVPQLAKPLWALAPTQVLNEVVQTPAGFHVLKITAKEGVGISPLSEVQSMIKQVLSQQAQQDTLANWLKDQRQKTHIALSPKFEQLMGTDKTASQPTTVR